MPWANSPRHVDRYYQAEAEAALLAGASHGPCAVELATGSGKSTIVKNLLKKLGLPAVVMAPSTNIASQLYDDLVYAFGKRYVGLVGDGRKEHDKHFVVGIDDSLSRIDPESPLGRKYSEERKIFVADESHLCPASSLRRVCFGLMANAPYRFFVSATQMRNDGADLLLEGITGPVVYRKTLRELVDEGYLAKPSFKMVSVRSTSSVSSYDANRMTRAHLYYNPLVAKAAAELANRYVGWAKRPTLILVEELEQFRELLPHLQHPARFAHGPLNKDTKELVPEGYREDKPAALVEAFNEGKVPILVGTSCIATGTDIQTAEAGIYLMGKTSKIKVAQALGRLTRGGVNSKVFNPWTGKQKLECVLVDFRVADVDVLERHADERAKVYEDLYAAPTALNTTPGLGA